jgi:hypothetical protein
MLASAASLPDQNSRKIERKRSGQDLRNRARARAKEKERRRKGEGKEKERRSRRRNP